MPLVISSERGEGDSVATGDLIAAVDPISTCQSEL